MSFFEKTTGFMRKLYNLETDRIIVHETKMTLTIKNCILW